MGRFIEHCKNYVLTGYYLDFYRLIGLREKRENHQDRDGGGERLRNWLRRLVSYKEGGAQMVSLHILIHFALFRNLSLYHKILHRRASRRNNEGSNRGWLLYVQVLARDPTMLLKTSLERTETPDYWHAAIEMRVFYITKKVFLAAEKNPVKLNSVRENTGYVDTARAIHGVRRVARQLSDYKVPSWKSPACP